MDKEDVVHIYKGILLSHKRNEILPFAKTWMDLKTVIQSDIYIYIYIYISYCLYVQSRKIIQMNLLAKQK